MANQPAGQQPSKVTAPRSIISAAVSIGAKFGTTSTAADVAAWRGENAFTTRLPLDTIERHAASMKSFGAFATTFTDYSDYRLKVVKLLSQQPDLSSLDLHAADIEEPTPFDAPRVPAGGAPGGPRRPGLRGGAAQQQQQQQPQAPQGPARQGPADLRWLSLTRASELVDSAAALPMAGLLRLWTLLPDRCSDAERRDARSIVRANAEMLAGGVVKAAVAASPSDPLLAASLPAFLATCAEFPLPRYRAFNLSTADAVNELRDTLLYEQGSATDRSRAVSRRLLLAKRDLPELVSLLEELGSPEERVSQLERLSTLACPGRHSQALELRLSDISAWVTIRASAITQLRNKGKAGSQLLDILLDDARDQGTGPVVQSAASVGEETSEPIVGAGLSALALSRALGDDGFVQAAASIAAESTDLAAGRRKVLEIATGAGCMIFQQLLYKPAGLKARHPALGAAHASSGEFSTYLGRRQAMGEDGKIDPLAAEWQSHPSQVALLLKGKVSQMQLVNPPYGVVALLNLTAAEPFLPVPDDQMYVTESVLDALGPFGHQTIVAWAGPGAAISSTGYTFKTLCEKQRSHVAWIRRQGDRVQDELLPHANAAFRAALERIDLELARKLECSHPRDEKFTHLLSFGEAYDQALQAKRAGVAPLLTVQRALPGLVATSAPRSLPGVVLEGAGSGSRTRSQREGDDGEGERASKKPKSDPPKPGSKKQMATWVDDAHLRLGNDTFDISGYVAKLGLEPKAAADLCWPVLVSKQPKKAALAFCPCPDAEGHVGINAVAHRRPSGFDLDVLNRDFCEHAPPQGSKGKGGGKNKSKGKRK